MEGDSFVFYRSFYDAIRKADDEAALKFVRALCAYALDGEAQSLDGISEILFDMAKPQIDANKKRRLDGQKGGRPKKEKPVVLENENHRLSDEKPNVNVNVNENVNVNDNENVNVNVNEKRKVKKKNTLSLYEDVKANYSLSENMDLTLIKWFTYRDNIRKPLAEKSITQLIEKVIALERQYGYLAVAKCFDNSIDNGYQGVFFDKIAVTPMKDNKSEVDAWFRKELGG